MMPILKIKPLSVNKAWQGKRFKTKAYKDFETEMLYILPKKVGLLGTSRNEINRDDRLCIHLGVGYSNKRSDIDNFIKPTLDILQKKYNFNDSQIYELYVHKEIVKKGEEFIYFTLTVG